ncbi:hypothetical protein [Niabella sp.]|uniref:hypothetical protein n=1 Tax=Niabella sp. TaxID=1962976 RepID=UPI002637FC34|nr:hypothetical protein [Niabella sp.]
MVAADTQIAPAALFYNIVVVKADTESAHLRRQVGWDLMPDLNLKEDISKPGIKRIARLTARYQYPANQS